MNPKERISRRQALKIIGTTIAGGFLAACGGSVSFPTESSVPTSTLPPAVTGVPIIEVLPSVTAVPPTPNPSVTPQPEAVSPTQAEINKTILKTDIHNMPVDLSDKIFQQGAGGAESTVFGEPKISLEGWTAKQIDDARAMLSKVQQDGELFVQEGAGKIVYQRATGPEYDNKPDAEVPFTVTVTTVPSAILASNGNMVISPEKSELGLARYINEADGKLYEAVTRFEILPGFLPQKGAFYRLNSQDIQLVLIDGEGNPRLMTQKLEFKEVGPEPTATPEVIKDEWVGYGTNKQLELNPKWSVGLEVSPDVDAAADYHYQRIIEGLYWFNKYWCDEMMLSNPLAKYGVYSPEKFLALAKSGKAVGGMYIPIGLNHKITIGAPGLKTGIFPSFVEGLMIKEGIDLSKLRVGFATSDEMKNTDTTYNRVCDIECSALDPIGVQQSVFKIESSTEGKKIMSVYLGSSANRINYFKEVLGLYPELMAEEKIRATTQMLGNLGTLLLGAEQPGLTLTCDGPRSHMNANACRVDSEVTSETLKNTDTMPVFVAK